MTQKLKTFVLRKKQGTVHTPGPSDHEGIPGAQPVAAPQSAGPVLEIEAHELVAGERAEIETEAETVATGISMPFTLIEPHAVSAAIPDGGNWGIAAIGADTLDEAAGAGIKVAVLDTGIVEHEAFDGLNPVTQNFTQETDVDINGHGTHCAGTIFGQDVDGRRIGVARGIRAPLIGKVLGEGGGGSEAIFEAILWAQRNGASVVSMSLGIDFPGFQRNLVISGRTDVEATSIALQAYRDNVRLFDQISQLFSNAAVINAPLLIAAAGNESYRPEYTIAAAPPATADDILSVAAIDAQNNVARFSNTLADCCGPGVAILSAAHTGGLKLLSGTSMATPHVAGLAAVEAATLAESGNFTAQQLREAVLAKASPVPGLGKADIGRGMIMVRP